MTEFERALVEMIPGQEVSGTDCKVYLVDALTVDSTTMETTGTLVGGQTGAELTKNREIKEIGHKDLEGGYAKQSAGKLTWEVSFDGCYIFGDAGYDKIEQAMNSKSGEIGVYIEVGTRRYVGKIILTTQSLSMPYDEEATYSVAGTGTGMLKRIERAELLNFNVAGQE